VNQPLATAPWGAWIGVYVVLTGLASGLTLVTRLLRSNDEQVATAVEWICSWISLAVMVICSVILIADLERPTHFFLMVTQLTSIGSLMSWGAKIIALKLALLALQLFLLHRRRQAFFAGDAMLEGRWTLAFYSVVPELLALTSFALAVYPAFLLSWTWSSPAASSPGSALLYLLSAALLGVATVGLVASFAPRLHVSEMRARASWLISRLLGAQVIALGFFLLALRGNATRVVFDALWGGRWAGILHLLVGATALALVLAMSARAVRGRAVLVALCVAVLAGAATSRYLVFAVH
jgi:formate-dependent nitrite reductase membrane component NrfD